jgi:hypothetical protein
MVIQYPKPCRNIQKKKETYITVALIGRSEESKHNLKTLFANRRYGKQPPTSLTTSLLTRVFISDPERGNITW